MILQSGKVNTYTYSVPILDASNDYVLKATNGSMVLRALINKAVLAGASTSKDVDNITTTALIVVEKTLALTPGTLGQSASSTQVQAASAALALSLPPTTIENNLTTSLAACASNSATAEQAQLASLANIVKAAVINNVDPAAFAAGTVTTTLLATTYTVSGTTVTSSTASISSSTALTTATAITTTLPKISSAGSATFTVGTSGTFTVTGTGTLSVSGALPTGVAFNAATGVLSGTPATGSNGVYSLTFTATSSGLIATQAFTLTVNPAVVTPPPAATTALSVIQSGMYDVASDSIASGTTNTPVWATSRIGLAADGVNLTDTYTYFDLTSKTWTTTRPTSYAATVFFENYTDYYLTPSGWVSVTLPDSSPNVTITFNSDGTATLTNKTDGSSRSLAVSATDISGQTLSTQPGLQGKPFITTAGVFPAGSIAYNETVTVLTDSYDLWNYSPSGVTTLSQIPASIQQVYINDDDDVNDYYAKFVSGGTTVDIYQQAINSNLTLVKIGSGSYATTTVSGQQILEITIPATLRTQYKLAGNPIYSVVSGKVYEGIHSVPGSISSITGDSFNSVAIQHVQNSLNTGVAKIGVGKAISKSILGL